MTRNGRIVLVLVVLLAAVFHGAFIARSGFDLYGERTYSLFDDAMISMRYAQNAAQGYGLVWNPGEAPVEGYTNLLWTLFMAAAHLLPGAPGLTVMIFGALALAGCVLMTARVAVRAGAGSGVAVSAAVSVAAYYPLAFWTLRGMEVGLQALILLGLLAVLLRATRDDRCAGPGVTAYGLVVAAVLLRPDGVIGVGVVLAAWWCFGRRRDAMALGGVLVLAVAVLTAFRWAYYGDPLPNTYYLKSSGVPLSDRIARGGAVLWELLQTHLWPLAAGLVVAAAGWGRRWFSAAPLALSGVFLAQAGYSVFVGGDAWEWMDYSNRFIAPAVPAALVFVTVGCGRLAERAGLALPAAAAAALLVSAGMNARPLGHWARDNAYYIDLDARAAGFGAALNRHTEPGTRIAVVWAGAIPYFARRPCVDLLGKNDTVIARLPGVGRFEPGHNKWNYRHSIGELHPDIVFQTSFVWREPGFVSYLARQGYERLDNGIWVHRDADGVDRKELALLDPPSD